MIVERPFKNFLDLILFPKSSIFKKQKDLDDDDDDDSSDSSTDEKDSSPVKKASDGSGKKKDILCGFCQDDAFTPGGPSCDCKCLVTKKKCKCIDKVDSVLKPHQTGVKRVLKDTSDEILVGGNNENSVLESTVKGTFNAANLNFTKSELEKKRVSFDVAYK